MGGRDFVLARLRQKGVAKFVRTILREAEAEKKSRFRSTSRVRGIEQIVDQLAGFDERRLNVGQLCHEHVPVGTPAPGQPVINRQT